MDPAGKVAELAESLAFDASDWAAFEGVVALLTERESWPQLDRAYRRMLRAVVSASCESIGGRSKRDVERALWRSLAVLYRDRLADAARAIEALEVVATLSPGEPDVLGDLAALYEETDDLDRAAESYERILRMGVGQPEVARALFDIHLHGSAIDAAWCVATVIDHCGMLDGSARDFFEDHRPRRLGPLAGSLGEREWESLLHEDADMRLVELFALTSPICPRSAMAAPSARAYASRALGVALEEGAEPLSPSTQLDAVLDNMTIQQQLFQAGREVALERLGDPPPVPDLVVRYLAAARLCRPDAPVPSHLAAAVERERLRLRATLDTATLERVARILSEFPKVVLGEWRRGIDATALRAGLLIAGDLETVSESLAKSTGERARLPPDLLAFAASTAHVELRALLGRAVGQPSRDHCEADAAPSTEADSIGALDEMRRGGSGKLAR